jgi:hypothetical protein
MYSQLQRPEESRIVSLSYAGATMERVYEITNN